MNRFKFYWKDGTVEESYGKSPNDAFKTLGHKMNELRNLYRYEKLRANKKKNNL